MSDWRERANKRRDELQTKLPALRPPGGSAKDTKRWCRGKVGREHKPVCVDYNTLKNATFYDKWKTLVCETCSKRLDHYFPSPFQEQPSPPPAWVLNPFKPRTVS
jgi:hypothetical protein